MQALEQAVVITGKTKQKHHNRKLEKQKKGEGSQKTDTTKTITPKRRGYSTRDITLELSRTVLCDASRPTAITVFAIAL